MLCRHCGAENHEGNLYCSRCGRRLDTDTPEKNRGWAPQEARKKTYAQLATEEDQRRREERVRRKEDGKTLAGIAAVIAAAAFLLAGVCAGGYAAITHFIGADAAEEMNYTATDSTEDAGQSNRQNETVLSGTAETSPEPVQTEAPAQSTESVRAVVTPEISPVPSPSPTESNTAGADNGDTDQDMPYDMQQEYEGPSDDRYDVPYEGLPGEPDRDDDQEQGEPAYHDPEDDREHTDTDEEGPDGFIWDIITGFYSIGAEAA